MQKDVSPEEKLLNLIKKGAADPKEIPEKPEEKEESVEESVQEPVSVQKAPITVPKKKRLKGIKSFSILNKFFIVCIVGAIAYMVFSYLYPYKSKVQIPEKFELKRGDEILEGQPKPPPVLSHYADILSRRQMFKLYEAPRPTPTGPPKPKVTLQQLLGGYTFVGIIFGEVPQAIVEEKRSGQSFYLTAGQFLGEIKIEKIERGKITVSYEEERMDISI